MGNCCCKSSKDSEDNFTGPGRRVGDAGQSNTTTHPVPSIIATTPGRKLVSRSASPNPSDIRGAAATAAEARVNSKRPGKLAMQLAKERQKTRNELLNDVATENLAARDADQIAQVRAYN